MWASRSRNHSISNPNPFRRCSTRAIPSAEQRPQDLNANSRRHPERSDALLHFTGPAQRAARVTCPVTTGDGKMGNARTRARVCEVRATIGVKEDGVRTDVRRTCVCVCVLWWNGYGIERKRQLTAFVNWMRAHVSENELLCVWEYNWWLAGLCVCMFNSPFIPLALCLFRYCRKSGNSNQLCVCGTVVVHGIFISIWKHHKMKWKLLHYYCCI